MALSQDVKRQLNQLNSDIEEQIAAVKELAAWQGVADVFDMQSPDGKFVMSDLLLAKSNVLLALVTLEARGT